MEALVSDIIAVADELGIDDFAILASGISASIVIRLAILYEDRVSHLVLWDPLIQRSASEPAVEALTSILDENWGLFLETRYRIMMSAEEAHQAAELVRSSVSPEYFRRARRLWSDFDRTSDLDKVTCPTLVMHPYDREESRESSEFIASSIAGAKLAVVDDNSAEIFNCDAAAILTTIAEFIGVPESNYPSLQNREALGGENGGRMTPELTNRETEIVTLLAEGFAQQGDRWTPQAFHSHCRETYRQSLSQDGREWSSRLDRLRDEERPSRELGQVAFMGTASLLRFNSKQEPLPTSRMLLAREKVGPRASASLAV